MRPLALWATPRTVSTAFDKMMRTRGDHTVFTEPFSIPWYRGPDRRSERYGLTAPEATFESVLAQVLGEARERPVFVKEMAYQLGPLLEPEVLAGFRSTLLVRDPALAIPSLARIWPDFSDEEAGYVAQHHVWSLLVEAGEEPVIVDSDDLLADPERIIGAWCEAVGIEPRPDALTWEPGMPADWEPWADWFRSAAASTGFHRAAAGDPPRVPSQLQFRIHSFRPLYEELAANRISA